MVETAAKAGHEINPADYYPELVEREGKTRELPLADDTLLCSIARYLDARMDSGEILKPNTPLILSQKGGVEI